MDTADDSSPSFPLELEREIFETAANLHPETIPILLLVCQRVHEWVERLKYHSVSSNGAHSSCPAYVLQRAIRSELKPISFFRDRVRHFLYMDEGPHRSLDDTGLCEILSICTRIQSLVLLLQMSVGPSLLPYLRAIQPRRLASGLKELFPGEQVDFAHAMFTFITHLDVFDNYASRVDLDRAPSFALLPRLTHLGLYAFNDPLVATELLTNCTKLRVLIGIYPSRLPEKRFGDRPPDDPRLLSMVIRDDRYEEDWLAGVRGGLDFWARADAFVEKKRRGEIRPSSRCWIEEGDGIY